MKPRATSYEPTDEEVARARAYNEANDPDTPRTDREIRDALRNMKATEEARKTDPTVLHVYAIDPALLQYPTEEEREARHKEIDAEIARLEAQGW